MPQPTLPPAHHHLLFAQAIAYGETCTRKPAQRLTAQDLAHARAQALQTAQDEVAQALEVLIEFRGLREFYCGSLRRAQT